MPSPADTDLVVVFASGSWVEAEMVSCALDGHGIPNLPIDDNVCRIYPQVCNIVNGVKLLVRREDARAAGAVLEPNYVEGSPYAFVTIPLSLLALLFTALRALWRSGSSSDEGRA